MKAKKQPLSIYIHIPFCLKKCLYCDFLSAPASRGEQLGYVEALICEIKSYCNYFSTKEYEVISVFFGGGTPSLLEVGGLKRILDTIKQCFYFTEDAEISMECNPKTADEDKLGGFYQAGVNRLSIGLQSANDGELKVLGRLHNYAEFLDTYHLARKVGFQNINVDIMSALPGQTYSSYEETLKRVLALHPQHISAYSLIIEEGTPFYEMYGGGDCGAPTDGSLPDEDTEREMYYLTERLLSENGYERYEISNYAKGGFACRHNLSYWTGIAYLGFGIGAASYMEGIRYKCTSDINKYMDISSSFHPLKVSAVRTDNPSHVKNQKESNLPDTKKLELFGIYEEIHALSEKEKMEEFMYLGLRLTGGVKPQDFYHRFGKSIFEIYGSVITKMEELKLLCVQQEAASVFEKIGDAESASLKKDDVLKKSDSITIRLTKKGMDVANYVMSEFLLDD